MVVHGCIAACIGIKVSNVAVSTAAVKFNLSGKVSCCFANIGAGCKHASRTNAAGIGSLRYSIAGVKAYIAGFIFICTFISVICVSRYRCIRISVRSCCVTACRVITANGQCIHIHAFADVGVSRKTGIIRRKGVAAADGHSRLHMVVRRTGVNCSNAYCAASEPTCAAVNNIRTKRGIGIGSNVNAVICLHGIAG